MLALVRDAVLNPLTRGISIRILRNVKVIEVARPASCRDRGKPTDARATATAKPTAQTSRGGGTARHGKGLLVREREALFIISVAARLVDMHPSTLRKYERVGFLEPSRLGGKLRLYSPEDITRLRQIKYLVEEHGINLAGIELALEITQGLLRLRETFEAGAGSVRASRIDEARRALIDEMLEQLGVEPEEASKPSPGPRHGARYSPDAQRDAQRDTDERVGGRTR